MLKIFSEQLIKKKKINWKVLEIERFLKGENLGFITFATAEKMKVWLRLVKLCKNAKKGSKSIPYL